MNYLGLGSNLGDRRRHLEWATSELERVGVTPLASSSVYETAPVGEIRDQPWFLNACLGVDTELEPEGLLDACKEVELRLGRAPGGPRHGPRPVDVDILLLGDREHVSPRLEIPHPTLLERRFVLIPLLELDFALTTPRGASLADALARLPVEDQDVRLAGSPLRGQPAAGAETRS